MDVLKKPLISVFLLLALFTFQLKGQETTRTKTSNVNAWLMYFGNHKVSSRFGIHAEVQWRRHDVFSEDQQLLLRTGLDYHLKSSGRATVGYAFIKTYPYGEFASPNAFPEHRIWQQFLTSQTLGKIHLSHRYRLEQRFIGNAATGEMSGGRFENRFRYMAKLTLPIAATWKRPMFLAAYDEIFLNFGKDVAYNLFDQNRAYGALGVTLTSAIKIELGYLYQIVQLRSLDLTGTPKNKIENNHTLQIGVFSTLPFYTTPQ
jgi:hypothetical protein